PLAFLHGEGIVHRDLKPENILLRVESCEPHAAGGELGSGAPLITHHSSLIASPWPVLVDFGLVSQFAGEVSREALEVGGQAVGTLAYRAPEQMSGSLLDARADLYALGCILYELLTGRPPFLGASAAELCRAHLQADPAPPSRFVEGLPAG